MPKSIVRSLIVGLLLSASSAVCAQALPAQVQADLLMGKIEASLAAGKAQEALDGIAEYRGLKVKMPPALLFLEGRLAAIAKDYQRSRKALTEYLALPDIRNDKNYAAALALYTDVEKAAAREAAAKAASALLTAQTQCARTGPPAAATIASQQPGATFRECPFAPEMVIVPGGTFLMGSPAGEKGRSTYEGPQQQVSVPTMAVGKYEVTFDEWDACVVAGGCKSYRPDDSWGRGRQPVIEVSWDDATAYVAWLSKVTGKRYRLLSEAEWEYAARAGTTTPWSTGKSITKAQANFGSSSSSPGTKVVGSYPANAFGLHEMHGNVSEWTVDCWNESLAGTPPDGKAREDGDCAQRVNRGGSWAFWPGVLRSAFRDWYSTGYRSSGYGFRVARTLD